jgi:hypothetical protein
MRTIDRIVHPDQDVTNVGSVEAIEGVVRAAEPGRYHVDEISSDPLPSGHTSRRWGTVWQVYARPRPVAGPMIEGCSENSRVT